MTSTSVDSAVTGPVDKPGMVQGKIEDPPADHTSGRMPHQMQYVPVDRWSDVLAKDEWSTWQGSQSATVPSRCPASTAGRQPGFCAWGQSSGWQSSQLRISRSERIGWPKAASCAC